MEGGSTTIQKGVVTRTLGNSIYVWPLDVRRRKELVFEDMARGVSSSLKTGDWIQMEVIGEEDVVYRERIEPILPTFITARGTVRVKTRVYFPDGLYGYGAHIIGHSDELGRVGVFFRCPDLRAKFVYDAWVSRPRRKHAALEQQYDTHWCLARQTLIPLQSDGDEFRSVPRNYSFGGDSEQSNSGTRENNDYSQGIDFSYALDFNNQALRKLYSNPIVREAVRRHNIDFANSIDDYLNSFRN